MIVSPSPSGSWPITRTCENPACFRMGAQTNLQLAVVDGAIVLPTLLCSGCYHPLAKPSWSMV